MAPATRSSILKWLLRAILGLIVLVLCAALAVLEEYWRTSHAWAAYEQDALAHGARFDPAAFVPPPVPDDDNFAATPLLQTLLAPAPTPDLSKLTATNLLRQATMADPFTKRVRHAFGALVMNDPTDARRLAAANLAAPGALLAALQEFAPEMAEITAASSRPQAQLKFGYSGLAAPQPNLEPLLELGWMFRARAQVALAAGAADPAFADTLTILRLADLVKDGPIFTAQAIRVALNIQATAVVWQGLAEHRWSVAQLAALQTRLSGQNFIAAAHDSLDFERAAFVLLAKHLILRAHLQGESLGPWLLRVAVWPVRSLLAEASLHQNLLTYNRLYDADFAPVFDVGRQQVFSERAAPVTAYLAGSNHAANSYNFLVLLALDNLQSAFESLGENLATIDETAVACALERYHLAHGAYPETLTALQPDFAPSLPHDVFSGAPLHYTRTPDGYQLYSVGPNGTDDHGDDDDILQSVPVK